LFFDLSQQVHFIKSFDTTQQANGLEVSNALVALVQFEVQLIFVFFVVAYTLVTGQKLLGAFSKSLTIDG